MGRREVILEDGMDGWILEGQYDGFYHSSTLGHSRTDTISYPGPAPYTETHVSVSTFVQQALEKIGMGKKVRITVEEV